MEFSNKVVLVTGASRGIGKEIATSFAKEGAHVILNYNNSYKNAKEIADKYSNIDIIKTDVSNEEEVKNMIDKIVSKYNHIDILVNNAAIADDSIIENKSKESFLKVIEVNLIGTFLVTKYASKYMNKESSVINISSTNGIDTNYPYSMDYDASKAGIISISKNFATLLAPIRVNVIAPGWVNTDMNANLDSDYKLEETNKIMLKRFAEPSEISNVCMFLASSKASYINNSVIRVDGGIL